MFNIACDCGEVIKVADGQLNNPLNCAKCGREIVCVCAGPLNSKTAAGDFDGALLVVAGPMREAQLIRLGGSRTIQVGAQFDNQIALLGETVSPVHARLVREEVAPSRWRIEDAVSGTGVFVNGERVSSRELADGDAIDIGEYELKYRWLPLPVPAEGAADEPVAVAPPEPVAAGAPAPEGAPSPGDSLSKSDQRAIAKKQKKASKFDVPGKPCPSCGKDLDYNATICVDCGIDLETGRPLLMSEEMDENMVYGNAEAALKVLSWFVWLTPLPIPVASSASGKFKPYATRFIAVLTLATSLLFMSTWGNDSSPYRKLMLWPRNPDLTQAARDLVQQRERARDSSANIQFYLDHPEQRPVNLQTIAATKKELLDKQAPFEWWQLVTHAFVHDTALVGILQLGANLIFLLVFGSRVNAIIGNWATLILYPLLAAAAGLIYLFSVAPDQLTPLAGATGAINGLAGIYLMLLPASFVYCAMWARFRGQLAFKIFALRGIWLLLIYFVFDVLMTFFGSQRIEHSVQAGGFVIGVVVGIGLLTSRQFECQANLLSICLGRYSWPIVGKPSRWAKPPEPAPVANGASGKDPHPG